MEEMLEMEVTGLAHDGRAVGRVDGRVVFARGGLPGQRIWVQITGSKKNFAEGECAVVLVEAPDAVPALCPHSAQCGGCPLQQMPLARQHYWKSRMLAEALVRIGKVPKPPLEPLRPSPQSWGYRNKMEFAFGVNAEGEMLLGLRGGGSHKIFDATQCALLPAGGLAVLAALRDEARQSGLDVCDAESGKGLLRFAVLRMPLALGKSGQPQILLSLITARGTAQQRVEVEALGKRLLLRCPQLTGFVHEERHAASLLAQGERRVCALGESILYESLGGVDFAVDAGGFFQVNTQAAEHLCALAGEMAQLQGQEILWDLYCGVGAPGLCLAGRAKALCGVESAPEAVNMAHRNAEALGFSHCHYQAGDVRALLPRLRGMGQPDVVLLDPPRAGLHADVVRNLLRVGPSRIIYISCNPGTLARDTALLAPAYTLARVVPVDLFPHTAHVESVSLFLPGAV